MISQDIRRVKLYTHGGRGGERETLIEKCSVHGSRHTGSGLLVGPVTRPRHRAQEMSYDLGIIMDIRGDMDGDFINKYLGKLLPTSCYRY